MLIGTHQSIFKMADIIIHVNNVSVTMYLGMYVYSNLKWDNHINNIIPKISAKIGIVRSLRKVVPIHTLKHLYNAIVQPHFDYVDVVYY